MANSRRIIFNTRERLLSGDFNDATTLFLANDADNAVALATGASAFSTSAAVRRSGILSGGAVSAPGGGLTVSVGRMVGYKYVSSPPTALDSVWQVVQTTAPIVVDLAPFVDPANPVWVAIEVAPGDVAELVSVRDIFQPALGTFTTASVDKIRAPEAVVGINTGAPSPTPSLPPGVPGVIPLAYVYLPAAAVSITNANLISCKPIIGRDALLGPSWSGGGLDVVAPGGSVVTLKGAQFRRDFFTFPIEVPDGGTCDADIATYPNWAAGQSYPAGEQPVYAYVIPAPYPLGYDLDVSFQREFSGGGVQFIPSVDVNALVLHGLVVFSDDPPTPGLPTGAWSGGPSMSLNDPTWSGGAQPAGSTFYLGTVSKQNSGTPGLMTQRAFGAKVRLLEQDKLCEDFSTEIPPGPGALLQPGDFRNQSPLGLNNGGHGTAVVLPDAYLWDVLVEEDNNGGVATFSGFRTAEEPLTGPPDRGVYYNQRDNVGGPIYAQRYQFEVAADQGAFTWSHFCLTAGVNTFRIITQGYTDPVLALR